MLFTWSCQLLIFIMDSHFLLWKFFLSPLFICVQAELVAMMLRWLPEDITVHNEDLEGLLLCLPFFLLLKRYFLLFLFKIYFLV